MQTHLPLTLDTVPVLTWEAPARPAIERTKRWYIGASMVVVLVAIYGIVSGGWSLAIVSILAGGMYVLVHDHRPPILTIELYESGILLKGAFKRWDEFAGYWLLVTSAYTELHLTPKLPGSDVVIQTGMQDIARLRMILGQRIPELTQKREKFLDACIRLCKL